MLIFLISYHDLSHFKSKDFPHGGPYVRAIKTRWAALKACRRFDSTYACVCEITRLKSYQAHLFLHVAPLRWRVVCEMRGEPDLQSRCDRLTRLLLAMLHYSLTVGPCLSNRSSVLISRSQSLTACGSTGADGGLLKGLSMPIIKHWKWSQYQSEQSKYI